jgi:hypothetical protein
MEVWRKMIYMYQPHGSWVPRKENLVWRLKKDLYGPTQSPQAWYIDIDMYLDEHGFQ